MKSTIQYFLVCAFAAASRAASLHKRGVETYYIAYCFSTQQPAYTGTEIDYYQNGANGAAPDDRAPVPSALFNLGPENPGAFLNATFQDSNVTVAIEIPLVNLYTYITGIHSNFSDTGLPVGSLTRYPDLSTWNCVADNFSTVYATSSTACQTFAHCVQSTSSSSSCPGESSSSSSSSGDTQPTQLVHRINSLIQGFVSKCYLGSENGR